VKRTGEEMAVDAAPGTCMEGLNKNRNNEGNSARIAHLLIWSEIRHQT
jgi:hypothetical protein